MTATMREKYEVDGRGQKAAQRAKNALERIDNLDEYTIELTISLDDGVDIDDVDNEEREGRYNSPVHPGTLEYEVLKYVKEHEPTNSIEIAEEFPNHVRKSISGTLTQLHYKGVVDRIQQSGPNGGRMFIYSVNNKGREYLS